MLLLVLRTDDRGIDNPDAASLYAADVQQHIYKMKETGRKVGQNI